MRKQIALLGIIVTAGSLPLLAGPVDNSKEFQPAPAPEEKAWSFSLSPYGWLTSVNGTISAGDRSADVDIAFKDVLKRLDMAAMFATELRYKRWGFMGDFIYARLHDDIAPPAGILFSSTHEVLKETIGTVALSYRFVDLRKKAYLDLFAGGRVYNFYTQIVLRPNLAPRGVNVDGTATWVDPIIGLRGRYYVSRLFFLNLYGDVGGFGVGSDISWQVFGSVGIEAARWCDVQLGYRALDFDYGPGRLKQEVTTHGPIIGAAIHF